jgi:DNA-directed RNA polymerase subunit RPC12/RpoP
MDDLHKIDCPDCGYDYARIYDQIVDRTGETILVYCCVECDSKWEEHDDFTISYCPPSDVE